MYSTTIKNLIEQFMTLPGIGPKTAERLALSLASKPKAKIEDFIKSLNNIKNLKVCQICHNFSDTNPCSICTDKNRDKNTICIVADATDLEAIETTKKFHGLYHILGGLIDPMIGITPDKLFIKELVNRIKNEKINPHTSGASVGVKEIILAFDSNIQGEATITYLKNVFSKTNLKITRLARGIPMGSDIEYTDEITLSSALENRKSLN